MKNNKIKDLKNAG
jgi:hypothetical protein